MMTGRTIPDFPDLGHHAFKLAEVVAEGCYMPHPDTVAGVGGPVFPAIRDQRKRITIDKTGPTPVFLDDNTTPRWALLWSHGISRTDHPTGWTFAHVWPAPKDPHAYTHLANLVMMPEYFASLTDKDGPLTAYLQFHAWQKYSWKPEGFPEPPEPDGFGDISWRYFESFTNPRNFIEDRIRTLDNQRTQLLRPLMGLEGVS